uniref:G-protein coupled receptors family 1 profile domain-containing protein n=1 Tax=Oreochromis aureus TaxID=47969 RepID=A0AAZ1XBA1_OREAU
MSLQNTSIKVTHFIIGGFDTVKRPVAVGVGMLITYLIAVIANVLNIVFIIFDKKLHKPMYLLICFYIYRPLLSLHLERQRRHGVIILHVVVFFLCNNVQHCYQYISKKPSTKWVQKT